jgi:hypothetical protein
MISQVTWHSGTVPHLRIPVPHTAFGVSDYDRHTRKSTAGRMPATTEDFVLAHASFSDICRCSMFGPRDESAQGTPQYIRINLSLQENNTKGDATKEGANERKLACEQCRRGSFRVSHD